MATIINASLVGSALMYADLAAPYSTEPTSPEQSS